MEAKSTKADLRKKFLSRRRLSVLPSKREQEAATVRQAAQPLLDFLKPGDAVASYLSFDTEVPTFLLNQAVLDAGMKLFVPCNLAQPRWGRLDPVQHTRALYRRLNPHPPLISRELKCANLADLGVKLIFLPAVAVDRTGTRLGRGAGWYDQALSHCAVDCIQRPRLVALVHDWEVLTAGTLPAEPHDQRVDQVLTSSGRLQQLTVSPQGDN